jgi:predicted nucleic acid-binding protein
MRIYFDMCSLQRPLDTKTQVRIAVEAEVILSIIKLWELGELELVSSQALLFEFHKITIPQRKDYVSEILSKTNLYIHISDSVEKRAKAFTNLGIKALDSLHLACSIEAKVDYFCTCDDRFLKRAKEVDTLQTKVVSPLELIAELEN